MKKVQKERTRPARAKRWGLCLATLLFMGCGSESPTSVQPPPSVTLPPSSYLMDGVNIVKTNETTYIDFNQYVQSSNAVITHIDVADSNPVCRIPEIKGLGVLVTQTQDTVCDYLYTVESDDLGQASATLTVISDSQPAWVLPQIDKKVQPDGHSLKIDLAETLGDIIWKDSYVLIPDQIYLQSIDFAPAEASGQGSVINVKAIFAGGWTRVLYYVKDSEKPDLTIYGLIYIHVDSDLIPNLPLEISNKDYKYNPTERIFAKYLSSDTAGCSASSCDSVSDYVTKGERNKLELTRNDTISTINLSQTDTSFDKTYLMITANQSNKVMVNIDGRSVDELCRYDCKTSVLAFYNTDGHWAETDLGYHIFPETTVEVDIAKFKDLVVSDPEGDAWQLFTVQTFGTTEVKLADPNYVWNTSFKFKAKSAGEKVVSYVVGDHYANYDSGVIRFQVEDPNVYPCFGLSGNFNCLPASTSEVSRKLFIPAGSVQAMQMLGITGVTSDYETGDKGPFGMNVAMFNYNDAEQLCGLLAANNFVERIDWVVPSLRDMQDYYQRYKSGNKGLFGKMSWPGSHRYWVRDTNNGGLPKAFDIITGEVVADSEATENYVTCLSLN
ncbi:peptidase [Vibrio campbellii]|uniref:hypothetical protein n=1 Tax=Vibrio TaxID=662 RepID=UPI0005316FBC|nr:MULTISPECIES: hypothetical protein [Vibrio]KGR35324.1 peptidase [Vibrio campbellii]CAD7810141.1 LysM domain [Vibrio sp. B1FIG11]CAE6911224.1 LysM domain [Vibrio sp. B1FIG11]